MRAAAGYQTALIGKWHLGKGDGFHPNQRGFDHFCGMLGGSHGYFPKPEKNQLQRNGEPLNSFFHPYLTDHFTEASLKWLGVQTEKPWFLFLSYNAPHGPLQATKNDLAKFMHIKDKKRRTYAAMMFALDRGVGRVRSWLSENGQLDNTLIVFFLDNGGAPGNASWNGRLSGVKGSLREGRVRVPMIWSWPSKLPKGTRCETPVSSLDLLPTFLAAAEGAPLPLRPAVSHEDKRNHNKGTKMYGAYDGVNLLPILKGDKVAIKRNLYWRLQGQAAIRSGDDKLIRLSHRSAQFFHPALDLAEARDLAPQRSERFQALFRQLAVWEASLPTVPLWGSSPFWSSESAKHYDDCAPRPEPQ